MTKPDLTDDPFGFVVYPYRGVAIFNCGWHAPIVDMIDKYGDSTDEPGNASIVVVKAPEQYLHIRLNEGWNAS